MTSTNDWPEWLERIWWRDASLTMEAVEPAVLPPYFGSTLRGALGHLLRTALCDGSGCGHECQRPQTCKYYGLFERTQGGAKPFMLLAPLGLALEQIALGGPVNLPYRTGPPREHEPIPTLRCEASWQFDAGETLSFGLRLIGSASNALPAILDAVAQYGLEISGARFRLVTARDASDRILYDRRLAQVSVQTPAQQRLILETEAARKIRVAFLSPAMLKLGNRPTFSPQELADRFFESAVGRAGQAYQTCWGERPAWIEPPVTNAKLAGHRLFHYDLPRHSFRQEKWLEFDGVLGYIDIEGDLRAGMPWARAAEALHFGQKSAFGLGKVRVFTLE